MINYWKKGTLFQSSFVIYFKNVEDCNYIKAGLLDFMKQFIKQVRVCKQLWNIFGKFGNSKIQYL